MDKQIFASILKGAEEASAISRGEIKATEIHRVTVPESFNVKSLREKLKMTQEKFCDTFGFSLSAVRKWEQGKRVPERPIRTLLKVIEYSPETVIKACSQVK